MKFRGPKALSNRRQNPIVCPTSGRRSGRLRRASQAVGGGSHGGRRKGPRGWGRPMERLECTGPFGQARKVLNCVRASGVEEPDSGRASLRPAGFSGRSKVRRSLAAGRPDDRLWSSRNERSTERMIRRYGYIAFASAAFLAPMLVPTPPRRNCGPGPRNRWSEYTKAWTGERFPDGRPKVPDAGSQRPRVCPPKRSIVSWNAPAAAPGGGAAAGGGGWGGGGRGGGAAAGGAAAGGGLPLRMPAPRPAFGGGGRGGGGGPWPVRRRMAGPSPG